MILRALYAKSLLSPPTTTKDTDSYSREEVDAAISGQADIIGVLWAPRRALLWIYEQGDKKRRDPKQRLRQAEELPIPP